MSLVGVNTTFLAWNRWLSRCADLGLAASELSSHVVPIHFCPEVIMAGFCNAPHLASIFLSLIIVRTRSLGGGGGGEGAPGRKGREKLTTPEVTQTRNFPQGNEEVEPSANDQTSRRCVTIADHLSYQETDSNTDDCGGQKCLRYEGHVPADVEGVVASQYKPAVSESEYAVQVDLRVERVGAYQCEFSSVPNEHAKAESRASHENC